MNTSNKLKRKMKQQRQTFRLTRHFQILPHWALWISASLDISKAFWSLWVEQTIKRDQKIESPKIIKDIYKYTHTFTAYRNLKHLCLLTSKGYELWLLQDISQELQYLALFIQSRHLIKNHKRKDGNWWKIVTMGAMQSIKKCWPNFVPIHLIVSLLSFKF